MYIKFQCYIVEFLWSEMDIITIGSPWYLGSHCNVKVLCIPHFLLMKIHKHSIKSEDVITLHSSGSS